MTLRRVLPVALALLIAALRLSSAQVLSGPEETALVAATRKAPVSWTAATRTNTAATVSVVENPGVTVTLRTTGTVTGGSLVFEVEAGDAGAGTWFPLGMYGIAGGKIGQRDEQVSLGPNMRQAWQAGPSGWVRFRVRLEDPITGTGTVSFLIGVR